MKRGMVVRLALLLPLVVLISITPATAQAPLGSSFTFQGRLVDGGLAGNGVYDFFTGIFAAESDGMALSGYFGDNVAVSSGLFSLPLSLGDYLNGRRAG